MAQLIGIAKRTTKRAEMQLLDSVVVSLERGVGDDFRGRPGKRQVTVIACEAWRAVCDGIGVELPWVARRANLLVEGLELENSGGRVLKVGDVRLLVTKETAPCERMEEVHKGLFAALAAGWRGGVCCRVLQGGKINLGDKVELIDAE